MSESKRRRLAHPETYGTKDCPGAGIRTPNVVLLPRTVTFMPAISPMTMPRRVGRAVFAIKRRHDLVSRVRALGKLLGLDPVTAAAWLDTLPVPSRRKRLRHSRVLSDAIPEARS